MPNEENNFSNRKFLTMKKLLQFILILFLASQHAHAGDHKNHWLLITQGHDTLIASRLDRILDSELFYSGKVPGSILTDSVMQVVHVLHPHYGINISIGATAGFLLGLIIGGVAAPPEDPNSLYYGINTAAYAVEGSFVGSVVGAVAGTAISYATHKSKIYDLGNMTSEEKKVTLKKFCMH